MRWGLPSGRDLKYALSAEPLHTNKSGKELVPARDEPRGDLRALLLPQISRPKTDVLHTNTFWEGTREFLMTYFWLFHGLKVRGLHNVPARGPVIFAPNHVSYYDPPLIAACVPYRVRTMAWEKLFTVPGLRFLIIQYGAYPVKLKSADKSAVAESLRVLRNGECLIVFPEGERGRNGHVQDLEAGVARIALQTGATVVPISITGAFESFSRFKILPRWFHRMTVKFHEPVRVDVSNDRKELRAQIARINEGIRKPIRRRLEAWYRIHPMSRKAEEMIEKAEEAERVKAEARKAQKVEKQMPEAGPGQQG